MKNLSIYFCLLMMVSISAQAQLSMFPNSGVHGQTLQTTITGGGIFIQANTPSGNIFEIKLVKGTDVITVFDYNNGAWWGITVVQDPNTVNTEVIIPPTIAAGAYDLQITTGDVYFPYMNQNFYSEPAAFTVLPPDGYIIGNVYDDSNNNGIKDVGESGFSGRYLKLLPLNFTVITDANGDYSIPVANGSYSVAILNSSNDYLFNTSQDTLQVTINNNNSPGNDFGLRHALVSISPDTSYIGETGTHQITADKPIFVPGGNPYGNISVVMLLTSPNINLNLATSVTVIDSFTVDIIVTLPGNTIIADSIDIRINTYGTPYAGDHYLRKKFNTGPPDGYVTGTIYDDNNRNGIQDVGELGLNSRQITILPENTFDFTDATGNYSIGASNGSHSLVPINSTSNLLFSTSTIDTIPVTINNNTVTENIGLATAMYSITPNIGYKGVTTLHQIVADKPIFIPGANPYGNISAFTVYCTPSTNINISNITVIDSFTIQVYIYIPTNANVSINRDLRLYTNSGFVGYHYLRQQFDIENPPYFISGKAFFDLNQNKLYDVAEPGIYAEKIILTPDNTAIFTDGSGNYIFGSLGGSQTIAASNNVPGLTLFTDSASFTMNVTSNVTGKDFGFISTLPDYYINVSNLSLFTRCNTNQYAKFKVRNSSNVPYGVLVWIKASPNMTYINSLIPPTSISNDTIYWNIANLNPFSEINFNVLYQLPGAGSTVGFTVGATSLDAGGAPQLSSSLSWQLGVFCAMDPNDKAATPEGVGPLHYTLMSDTLQYLIRFQNTGNDTAFKVVILDTLDNDLLLSSFEVLGSSHSALTELKSNGAVKFTFENILLPDSNVNEPGSHGYISYSIRPKNNLVDYTPVENTAHIFFDFNSAVVTNTTLNTLVYVIPTGIDDAESTMNVIVYPNPFNQSATLQFENPNSDIYKLDVTTIDGKTAIAPQFTSGDKIVIEKNKLSQGIYFYQLTNSTTNQTRVGKIIVE